MSRPRPGLAMRRSAAVVGFLGLLAMVPFRAGAELDRRILERLKGATVLVATPGSRGTGFLISRRGETGVLVTNAHVLVAGEFIHERADVVFHSGMEDARIMEARLLAYDTERDLAFLAVTGRDLPEPLDPARGAESSEALPVYVFGFPFGEALAADFRTPEVTVTRGAVASLRQDDYGQPRFVQLDADINPGNSGGPVVAEAGRLVGVAVAAVDETKIGLAIPAPLLRDTLAGRVFHVEIEETGRIRGELRFRITAGLCDPGSSFRSVTALVVDRASLEGELHPATDGSWGRLAQKMQECRMEVSGQRAEGEIVLVGDPEEERDYVIQVCYTRGGSPRFTEPIPRHVRFALNASAEVAEPGGGDGWLGQPTGETLPVVESGDSFLGERREVDGVVTIGFALPRGHLGNRFVWSSDGRSIFLIHREKMVRKVAVPSMQEERNVTFPGDCFDMALSGAGLIVTSLETEAIYVLDPDSLALRRKIPVPGLVHLAVSNAHPLAAVTGRQGEYGHGALLTLINLETGRVLNEYGVGYFVGERARGARIHERGRLPSNYQNVRMSPDGQQVYIRSEDCIHRFRIQGERLEYEEAGPALGAHRTDPRVEASGYAPFLSTTGSDSEIKGHPPSCMHFYRATNLQSPEVSIEVTQLLRGLALDSTARRVYTAQGGELHAWSMNGRKIRSYGISAAWEATDRVGDICSLSVHPGGRRLLTETVRKLLWVEMPE